MRGRRRSVVGPGTSASKSCIPPTPRIGRMARERTMMPIPPSHWVRERQRRTLSPITSRSVITVEPVVVKPDMDSK